MARSVAFAVALAALAVICAVSSVSAITAAPGTVPAPTARGAPAATGTGVAPKPKAGPPPTKTQLRAELKKLSATITAKYPKYSKYSTQVNKAINVALNSKYNLTALQSATILLMSDVVADRLSLRFKGKKLSNDAAYNLTAVQIIATRLQIADLQAIKKGQLLPTQLKGVNLVKMSPAGPKVMLGQQGLAKPTWSTVLDPQMYVGPYFVAHGVDNPQFPLRCADRSDMAEQKKGSVWSSVKPFVNGGTAGMMATCVIQPIDMVKVRIQLGQGSAFEVTKNILQKEGVGAFYKGLSAGLLRQATYTTARLGSFRYLTTEATKANDGKPLPLYQKAACGLTAGAIGACFGSPADLALIRMQADSVLPAAERRGYKNAIHALTRIAADEGVLALWKGAGPTVVRAMALNMGMLASYDQSMEYFKDTLQLKEIPAVIGASAVSGFFASACSLPFDYVKTQIQKQKPGPDGKLPYSSSMDCVLKTLKQGGPLKFYTGFATYCIRIAPHVMLTWIFLNQIQKIQKANGL
ncbi:unnamed protein product [Closterium sp. Yama58-4]|nr:unnamed protein product [Closterium sp. Yama58-4]